MFTVDIFSKALLLQTYVHEGITKLRAFINLHVDNLQMNAKLDPPSKVCGESLHIFVKHINFWLFIAGGAYFNYTFWKQIRTPF